MPKKNSKLRNWMVRCGRDSHLIEDFLSKGITAVGWGDLGELPEKLKYEEQRSKMHSSFKKNLLAFAGIVILYFYLIE